MYFTKALCLFVCLFFGSLMADDALYDSLTLQLIPGMHKYQISDIEALNPNFALAACSKGMLKWDGKTWSAFHPALPINPLNISTSIYLLSPENIYLFYMPDDRYYHTQILHFNGREWRFLPSPNPGLLKVVSFLDSQRFYAGGAGNSLIYYNGRTSQNIQTPPVNQIKFLQAFKEDHLFAVMETKHFIYHHKPELQTNDVLMEYQNGQWNKLASMDKRIQPYFFSPDSGIMVLGDNILAGFTDGQIIPFDTLHGMIFFKANDDHFYFSEKNTLYEYSQSSLKPVYQIEWSRFLDYSIHPMGPGEFFLKDEGRNLYYLGRRQLGVPVRENIIKFRSHDILNDMNNDTYGKSLYRNRSGGIDIYLTVAWRSNIFFTHKDNYPVFTFEDVINERGLDGYQAINNEKDMSDSGLFFADIDNDGDQDAVLTTFKGKCQLYENIGNDQFRNVTEDYCFKLAGSIDHVSWGDINRDGNLDFAVGNGYAPLNIYLGDGFFNFRKTIFHTQNPDSLSAYSPWLADLNNDGNLDVVVYSQFNPIKIFENLGDSSSQQLPEFADRSLLSPELTEPFNYYTQSMGIADYDNDGDLDLFLANRRSPLKLFRNEGDFRFTDVSIASGFGQSRMTYGANWGDLDQDGWLDLFVTTLGHNYIFWNRGNGSFLIDSLSLARNITEYSAGALLADFDSDNDFDILVANAYIGRTGIYENMIGTRQPLRVEVRGSRSNRFGLGTRLSVYDAGHAGEQEHLRAFHQITTQESYIGSTLPEATFYLSSETGYDLVALLPSGAEIHRSGISGNEHLVLQEPQTLAIRIMLARQWFVSFYKHPGRRPYTWRFGLLIFLILVANTLLWQKSLWEIGNIVFFNICVISSLILVSFFVDWLSQFHWVLWIFLLVLVAAFFGIQSIVSLQRRSIDPLPLYELLRQFSHGKAGMKHLDRLLFNCNNLSQDVSQKMRARAAEDARLFQEDTLPLLQEVLRHSRGMSVPAATYHNLRRQIKIGEKIGNVLRQNRRLPAQHNLQQFASSLKLLKTELNGVRNQIESTISCSLLATLNQSLIHFREFTDISLHYPPEIERCIVTMPRSMLTEIFNNIFENALHAMIDQIKRDIQISIENPGESYATVTICDAGPGIPRHLHERIFEDGFSTKGSTGFGLYQSRIFLEQFSGSIKLLENSQDKGACFQLSIKVKR